MKISNVIDSVADFIENNTLKIIILWFFIFVAYRITKIFLSEVIPWSDYSGLVLPGIIDAGIFLTSVIFFLIAFRLSTHLDERKRLILLFCVSFFLIYGFTQLSQPEWSDAQGYYDIAQIGAENGPMYIISNYHTLNTKWPQEMKTAIDNEFIRIGIYDWTKDILKLEVGETNSVGGRTIKQPPIWPLVLSLFFICLGTTKISALIAIWIISSTIPIVVYFLIKAFTGEQEATIISFISITIPSVMLSGNAPLMDNMVALLITLSFLFYKKAIDSDEKLNYLISGAFFSIAFFTKFMSIFFVFPIIISFILRKRLKFFSDTVLFVIPTIVLTILFMCMNYFFFITMITAKVREDMVVSIYNTGFVSTFALPIYYLNYFGIPLLIFAAVYLIRNMKRDLDQTSKMFWFFYITFIVIMIIYPVKTGMERQLLPFFLVLLVPISTQIKSMKISKRDPIIIITILITITESVLLAL